MFNSSSQNRVLQPQFLGALVQFFSRYALEEEEIADHLTNTT